MSFRTVRSGEWLQSHFWTLLTQDNQSSTTAQNITEPQGTAENGTERGGRNEAERKATKTEAESVGQERGKRGKRDKRGNGTRPGGERNRTQPKHTEHSGTRRSAAADSHRSNTAERNEMKIILVLSVTLIAQSVCQT